MADGSGVSQTNLELLLEFDGDYTDTSTNSRDQSSALGATSFNSDGAIGQAAQFIYTQQNYIDTGVQALGSADLFCTAAQPFTAAVWMRFDGAFANGAGTILARQKGTGNEGLANSAFFLHVPSGSTNQILLRLRGADNYYTVSLRDGEWHHFAVTWDGTDAAFYIDGTAQTAPNVGAVAEPAADIFIGASDLDGAADFSSNLTGELDDLRIYSRALNSSEITLLYNYSDTVDSDDSSAIQPEDLELHLKYEDDLLDSSPNSRHQTSNLVNGPLSFVAGQVDSKGVEFEDTSSQHIATGVQSFGDADLFSDAGSAWSVSAWVKYKAGSGGIGTVMARRMSSTGFRFQVTKGGANIYLRGQLNNYTLTGNDDEEWHHYAVTWDGSDGVFYYDGSAQTALTNGADTEGTEDIYIGANDAIGGGASLGLFFDAYMDDLRVYSRALSASDVSELNGLVPSKFAATLTLTSLASNVASFSVTFGSDPTAFVSGDVTTTNGTVSNVSGSGDTYTFDVTADADGVVEVQIAEDAVSDSDGATNKASAEIAFGVGTSSPGLQSFDRTASQAGQTATIFIGPIPISENAGRTSKLRRSIITLGNNTDATGTVDFYAGTDAEDATHRADDDVAQSSFSISTLSNNNGVCFPHVSGHALVIGIDITGGHLTFEQGVLELSEGGRNRMVRRA